MTFIHTAITEFLGLFVDDGALAILTLLLIAAVTVLIELVALPPLAGGALLFIGSVAILAESTSRAARKS